MYWTSIGGSDHNYWARASRKWSVDMFSSIKLFMCLCSDASSLGSSRSSRGNRLSSTTSPFCASACHLIIVGSYIMSEPIKQLFGSQEGCNFMSSSTYYKRSKGSHRTCYFYFYG